MKKTDVYFNFVELVKGINSSGSMVNIDPEAKLLLDEIAVHQNRNAPLTVSELMALSSIASPATIHRKLNALIDEDLVEVQFEGKNRRTKYLVVTSKANKYFTQLSGALNKAFKLAN
jgi:DNA-binding MarR family transcriptional regulator